jgi:hypothetical protein
MRDSLRRFFDRHPVLVFCLTRGSLFVMVIAHAAINASYFWVANYLGSETPPLFWILYWLLGAGLGLWAVRELVRIPDCLIILKTSKSKTSF